MDLAYVLDPKVTALAVAALHLTLKQPRGKIADAMSNPPGNELRLAQRFRLEIEDSSMTIFLNRTPVYRGELALRLLDAFARGVSLENGLSRMGVSGAEERMRASAEVIRLQEAGILINGRAPLPLRTDSNGFDGVSVHKAMLNDKRRTSLYLQSIHSTVHAGDVVVDIGTGTGVLAIAAARAGARHVYTIEAGIIGDLAKETFVKNGFADRITLIWGWSYEVSLPEPANVLVSELVGMICARNASPHPVNRQCFRNRFM